MRSTAGALGAALFIFGLAGPVAAAPAMWEVSDADSKIWLFGSVHVLPPDVDWRTSALTHALDTADRIYFEADIGPLGIMAMTIKLLGIGMRQASNPWIDRLSSDELETLTSAIDPLGMTLEQVGTYPPWMVELQIEQRTVTAEDDGTTSAYDAKLGVDMILEWELPQERKGYLETPGQQVDILANGTLDEQIDHLFHTIAASQDSGHGDLVQLVTAWSNGDVDTLAANVAKDLAGDDAYARHLLYDRNRNWLPTLGKLLADNQQDLIVVGAAHLAGADSVLDLLAREGYTIKRIQ